MSLEDFESVVRVNLTGTFIVCRAVVPIMKKQGRGKIVNISSIAGRTGRPGVGVNYAASKAGIIGLTRTLSREAGPAGVYVNAIAPGYILTEITRPLHDDPKRNPTIMDRLPVGRWGLPDDLVGPFLFLGSEAADYIHGTILPVDGGWLAR